MKHAPRFAAFLALLLGGAWPAMAGAGNDFSVAVSAAAYAPLQNSLLSLPQGITIATNNATQSLPMATKNMGGQNAMVTADTAFTAGYGGDVFRSLIDTQLATGSVAGFAHGPGFGFATAASNGSSGGLLFTNTTAQAVSFQITVAYSVTLQTDYLGYGLAEGSYTINLIDGSGTQKVASDSLLDVTGNHSFNNGVATLNITVAGKVGNVAGTDTVYLSASISGAAAVPEPCSIAMLGTGLAALVGSAGWRRRLPAS
jgi:hypothetical protein